MAFLDYDLQQKLQQSKPAKYLRRSSTDSEDKQMRSIQGQEEDIDEDVIQRFGLKNVKRFAESQTAFKEGRPEFRALIEQIKLGYVDTVIVWHPNRIARNYSDGGEFVQLMSDGKLAIVITPTRIFENNPRDKADLMNEFTRATEESDDKSEVVKRGNKTKLKEGYIPSGRLAEGFLHTKNARDEMINSIDPERFPLIERAIRLVLNQTHTPKEALDKLNNEWGYRTKKTKRTGGKELSDSTWYKLLSDPKYYYGEIKRKEGIFQFADDMPKPFSHEEFQKIQIILGSKSTRRRNKKDWPYTGLGMVCGECNGTIIMDEKWQIICPVCKLKFHKSQDRIACPGCQTKIADMVQPKILHYTWLYGNCKKLADGSKCPQPSLQVKDFDSQIDQLLSKITIPESIKDWAIKWLHKQHVKEVADRTIIKQSVQRLDTDVQKQLDDLLDFLLRNLITPDEYQRKKEPLLLELQQVRRKVAETDKRADDWLELSEKTFNFACYSRYWFAHGSNEQKRQILSTIGSNLVLKDKILSLYQRKPFKILNGMQDKIEILLDVFEPNDLLDDTAYSDTSHPVIPSLLPSRDSNSNRQIQNLQSYH